MLVHGDTIDNILIFLRVCVILHTYNSLVNTLQFRTIVSVNADVMVGVASVENEGIGPRVYRGFDFKGPPSPILGLPSSLTVELEHRGVEPIVVACHRI